MCKKAFHCFIDERIRCISFHSILVILLMKSEIRSRTVPNLQPFRLMNMGERWKHGALHNPSTVNTNAIKQSNPNKRISISKWWVRLQIQIVRCAHKHTQCSIARKYQQLLPSPWNDVGKTISLPPWIYTLFNIHVKPALELHWLPTSLTLSTMGVIRAWICVDILTKAQ